MSSQKETAQPKTLVELSEQSRRKPSERISGYTFAYFLKKCLRKRIVSSDSETAYSQKPAKKIAKEEPKGQSPPKPEVDDVIEEQSPSRPKTPRPGTPMHAPKVGKEAQELKVAFPPPPHKPPPPNPLQIESSKTAGSSNSGHGMELYSPVNLKKQILLNKNF